MAGALAELLGALGLSPDLAIGHSAGAAILVRMSLDGGIRPRGIVSLNGALLPLRGWAGLFFSPVAKLCSLSPRVAGFIARRATDPSAVERLIQGTGSTLDPAGVELYRRLISSPGHVAGAINMMANWELQSLERDLPRLTCPLALVVADRDRTVPPDEADLVLARLPTARRIALSGLGHLAHEEDAARVEAVVLQFARSVGVLSEP
jgi:magnesium chelatase accessory protein